MQIRYGATHVLHLLTLNRPVGNDITISKQNAASFFTLYLLKYRWPQLTWNAAPSEDALGHFRKCHSEVKSGKNELCSHTRLLEIRPGTC